MMKVMTDHAEDNTISISSSLKRSRVSCGKWSRMLPCSHTTTALMAPVGCHTGSFYLEGPQARDQVVDATVRTHGNRPEAFRESRLSAVLASCTTISISEELKLTSS